MAARKLSKKREEEKLPAPVEEVVEEKTIEVEKIADAEVIDVESQERISENVDKAFEVITENVLKLPKESCLLRSYKSKGGKTTIELETSNFELAVTIKNNEAWGL